MIEQVLQPLASLPLLRDRVRTRTRVLAVGRRGLTRTDFAGHPLRSERPFRLLLETEQGEEMLEADVILDATGGYVAPNGIGAGGLPARGERALERAPIRTLGQLEQRLPSLRGKRVAVLGHGHSAANAIERLAGQAREATGSKIIWIVRAMHRRPCEEVAGDPLQERQRVVGAANDLAQEPPPFLQVERRATIEAMAAIDGSLHLTLSGGREVVCDELAAFTGYGPNGSLQPELAIETSPVTLGAARLYRAISETNDCLSVPMVRPADLESGEPSYWLIGSRSYGRARTFLLNTGLQHLQVILGQIAP